MVLTSTIKQIPEKLEPFEFAAELVKTECFKIKQKYCFFVLKTVWILILC